MTKKEIIKNIEASVLPVVVVVLMVLVIFSSIIVFIPTIGASEGSVTTETAVNVGDYSAGFNHPALAYYDDTIWMVTAELTGSTQTDDVLRYNPNNNTWWKVDDAGAPFTNRRFGAYIEDVDNLSGAGHGIFLIGGYEGTTARTDIYFYCFDNLTLWDTGADLPNKNQRADGIIDNTGIVWIAGGTQDDNGATGADDTNIYCYNYGNNTCWIKDTWQNGEIGKFCDACYDSDNNIAYWVGGETGNNVWTDDIMQYNIGTGVDTKVEELLTGREGIAVEWNDVNESVVIIAGGQSGTYYDEIYWYTVGNDTLWETNLIPNDIYTHSCINLSSNTIYTCGGYDGSFRNYCYAIDYADPTINADLHGLYNNKITWTGEAGDTVWSNATAGLGGTMNITLILDATSNCTEIRVWCDDLDASIGASNISIQFSSNNATWGDPGNVRSFDDGGSNISINDALWTTGNGCYGTDPFEGAGLIDGTFYIYARFKLTIPMGVSGGTYTQSDWKVWYKIVTP